MKQNPTQSVKCPNSYLIMKRILCSFIALSIMASCSKKDEISTTQSTNSIIIPSSVRDTILTVTSMGVEIQIPISLPNYGESMPAVVIMHGSGGNWDDEDTDNDGIDDAINFWELSSQNEDWKEFLNENGYVSAFPGSYYPRGTVENAGEWKDPPLQFKISASFVRNHDAYATLNTLRKLEWDDGTPIVDSDAIGIVGFSHGGTAVQSTVFDQSAIPSDWEWTQSYDGTVYSSEVEAPATIPEEGGFAAAIMYYPGSFHNSYYGNPCSGTSIYRPYCDIMVHIAENDGLTDNTLCFVDHLETQSLTVSVQSYLYEGAAHSYDSKDDGVDKEASDLSRERSLVFLDERLK